MTRLYRPHIPIEVKCRVALRQLGEIWPDNVIEEWRPSNKNKARNLSLLLNRLLCRLSDLLGCGLSDLRLDHDPPLALRDQIKTANPKSPYAYRPDANDPEYLRYRPHGAQFAGSHDIKTRVRGDGAQFSDLALIRREKRRQKKERGKSSPRAKIKSRSRFPQAKTRWPKRAFAKRREP